MTPGLLFGIYAAQQVGRASGTPDDPQAIRAALEDLRAGQTLIVREYIHFRGEQGDHDFSGLTLPDAFYAQPHIRLDLVLCYQPQQEDVEGWLDFIERALDRYRPLIHFLQVTVEPNFNHPGIDGSSPGVRLALVRGLLHARQQLKSRGLDEVKLGFSVAEPQEWAGGDGDFWPALAQLGGPEFLAALDYLGLACYPDAFSPVAPQGQPGDVASLVEHALRTLREHSMPAAGMSAELPIHIVETGSPTDTRDEAGQLATLRAIVGEVQRLRERFGVTVLEWFSLRDADSAGPTPFHHFGLMYDDYRPKAAFFGLQGLIRAGAGGG